MAQKFWTEIPNHHSNVQLDEYIVMPNHIHGVLFLHNENKNVGIQNFEPLQYKKHSYQKTIPNSIGAFIRAYKAAVTLWCKKNGYRNFKWKRNFYEHIIRNKYDLNQIRQYIIYNPLRWELDRENPKNWNNLK